MKPKSPTPPERWTKLLDDDNDFFGERGCCLTCKLEDKDDMAGIVYDVWFGDKHYDCMCFECKCSKCMWYNPNPTGRCEYPRDYYQW